jgi:TonB-linked SusC/RagA family outer membrane protein
MRKLRLMVYLLTIICAPLVTLSQTRTVSGRVTNPKGEAVPQATIFEKGTTNGVAADSDGKFSITTSRPNATLVISSINYQTTEIKVGNSTVLPVILVDREFLSEVTVTALGIRKDRRALGYSAQEVKGDEIMASRQPNIVNALQGKATGLQINSTGGAPGQGARIVMRGITSLDPNRPFQPLFVIDGVPIDNSTDVGDGSDLRGVSNRAADINPDDIESVNILKGGAATALYGLRASTGAIIITTKTGKAGKLRATINSSFGFEEVNKYPTTQSKFTQGYLGEYDPTSFWPSWGPTVTEAKAQDPSHPDKLYNNYRQGYNDGSFFRNSVNVSGGSERAIFTGSFSQYNHEGVMPFNDYKNYSAKAGGEFKFSNKFRMGASVNYIKSGGYRMNADRYNEQLSYWAPRWDVMDYKKEDGTMKVYGPENDNPVYVASTNRYKDDVDRIISNLNFTISPVKWLDISYRFGADIINDGRTHTAPGPLGLVDELHPYSDNFYGFIEEYRINKSILNSTLMLNFKNEIGKHLTSSFKIGHDVYAENRKSIYAYGDTLVVPTFFNLSNAVKITGRSNKTEYRIVGVFADWTLSWENYLYLTLTGRNDWTSTLSKENRSFFYPSASASWIFSENFKLPDWISFGKLRFSIAKIGKDALPYSTSTGYNIDPPLTNNVLPFTLADRTGDANLKPEFTTSNEIGAEVKFLNNRLGLDFTYYNNTSKDLIIPVKIPISNGFNEIYLNAGEIRNKGIEISVNGAPIVNNNFSWDVRVNYTRNNNEVLSIYPGLSEIIVADQFGYLSSAVTQKYIPGYPVGALFGRTFERYYGSDKEDPMVPDRNRPMVIGANGFPRLNPASKQQYLGNSQPKWIGSISNTFRYKNFSLSFLFDAQQGLKKYNQMANFMAAFGIADYTENRTETIVFDGVLADGTKNTKPVYLGQGDGPDGNDYGNGYYRNVYRGASENFIEDASWIRLRSASLGYQLPASLLQRTGFVNGAGITFTGNNLWLHTNYTGFDPESSSFNAGSVVDGFAGFTYPATRSFIVSVNLNF